MTSRLARTLIAACLAALALAASAQVPPHVPGTICFVQGGWCWAPVPGPPGGMCGCPTPMGWLQGRLG